MEAWLVYCLIELLVSLTQLIWFLSRLSISLLQTVAEIYTTCCLVIFLLKSDKVASKLHKIKVVINYRSKERYNDNEVDLGATSMQLCLQDFLSYSEKSTLCYSLYFPKRQGMPFLTLWASSVFL